MESKIKNLELLPEEVRENFQAFLNAALDENSPDSEYRNFLINFLDNENGIDANEIWDSDLTQDRFLNYVLIREDLFSEFAPVEDPKEFENASDVNAESEFENLFKDETFLNEFSSSGQPPEPPPFDVDDSIDLDSETSHSTYSLPESNLDVPPSFDNENIPDLEIETEASQGAVTSEGEAAAIDEKASEEDADESVEERIARLESSLKNSQMGQAMVPGGGGIPSSSDTNGIGKLVDGSKKLANGILSMTGSTLSIGGAATQAVGNQLGRPEVKQLIGKGVSATGQGIGKGGQFVVDRFQRLFTGKGKPMTGDMREALIGLKDNSNVIDIKTRMKDTISKHSKTSVERDLAILADKKISGKRNSLLSTIAGIEEGKPNGRYSEIELAKGLTVGAAVNSIMNGSETEQAMARALIDSNENLPDAATEMDFVANEYQRLHDTLESLTSLAEKKGWSQEDISSQFGAPVEEWMKKREPEDKVLSELATIQNEGPDAELSPEELEKRQEEINKMVEAIKKLLDDIFNRGPSEEATMAISR